MFACRVDMFRELLCFAKELMNVCFHSTAHSMNTTFGQASNLESLVMRAAVQDWSSILHLSF